MNDSKLIDSVAIEIFNLSLLTWSNHLGALKDGVDLRLVVLEIHDLGQLGNRQFGEPKEESDLNLIDQTPTHPYAPYAVPGVFLSIRHATHVIDKIRPGAV